MLIFRSFIFFLLISTCGITKANYRNFRLNYQPEHLGSMMGTKLYPWLDIQGTEIQFTFDVKTAEYEIGSFGDTIWSRVVVSEVVHISENCVDSILVLVNQLEKNEIYYDGTFHSSGSYGILKISGSESKSVKISMHTFHHPTAIKIFRLLNEFLPQYANIHVNDYRSHEKRTSKMMKKRYANRIKK